MKSYWRKLADCMVSTRNDYEEVWIQTSTMLWLQLSTCMPRRNGPIPAVRDSNSRLITLANPVSKKSRYQKTYLGRRPTNKVFQRQSRSLYRNHNSKTSKKGKRTTQTEVLILIKSSLNSCLIHLSLRRMTTLSNPKTVGHLWLRTVHSKHQLK